MKLQAEKGVQYENVSPSYLDQRQLRKSAGAILLWGLGVGAVISGNFFGWNFGLSVGGFGGLTLATVLMAIMYVCMVYCLAELSTAMPYAGGFYSFARTAFGPWAGFLIGVTDTIEYIFTPAVVVVGIGSYLHTLFPAVPLLLWWVAAYTLSIAINILGAQLTLRVGLVLTLLAIGVLVAFYGGALWTGAFRWELLLNVPPEPGQTALLPHGWYGVFLAIPYAIWFFLAIEQVPLAAEEASHPARDIPPALRGGIGALILLALGTLVINSGVGGGALALAQSTSPLLDGFATFLTTGMTASLVSIFALSGLVASFHTLIYAYGRVLFSLSRAGYYPRWISVTGKPTQTPHYALIIGGGIGLVVAWLMDRFGSNAVGMSLLNMAVFGAVISYAGVMLSYIKLKRDRPDLPRPYTSPLGIPGAVIGTGLALLALLATFAITDNRPGVVGLALALLLAIAYFALHSSHSLVAQAPEEYNALSLEQRLALLQIELGQAQAARRQVEQVLVARANAVRAVIHDLNHTVQNIQAALDLWVMDLRDAHVAQSVMETGLARLQRTLDHQQMLLHEMRDAALLEGGKLILKPAAVNLGMLVQEVIDQVQPRYALADCALTYSIADDTPLAWCDPQRMRRVIYNLLDNALRYTSSYRDDDDSAVHVGITYEADEVVCCVRDNGRGIAPDDLQRLGAKFTRLAQGEQDSEGMGLGLNFCIGILRLSQGSLQITSPGTGQGTMVTVRVPSARSQTLAPVTEPVGVSSSVCKQPLS